MLKLILKIWPALLPLTIYVLWSLLKRKARQKDYIDAEYKVVNESQKASDSASSAAKNSTSTKSLFSLENKGFVMILFITLILIIFSLIFIVITSRPLKYEDSQAQQKLQQQKIIVE